MFKVYAKLELISEDDPTKSLFFNHFRVQNLEHLKDMSKLILVELYYKLSENMHLCGAIM